MDTGTILARALKGETLDKRGAMTSHKLLSGNYVTVKRIHGGDNAKDSFLWSCGSEPLSSTRSISEDEAIMLLNERSIE